MSTRRHVRVSFMSTGTDSYVFWTSVVSFRIYKDVCAQALISQWHRAQHQPDLVVEL